ncbi:hypothetical protein [Aestuariivirga sp.]|jgi:hypothetical protein|uniref:hypothetical protein n=1 Tax=Aestuariivirga sp. TaxID=2650926 RepID=UPI003BAAF8DD
MTQKFTDILTYVLSFALAAGVSAFAAIKVIELDGMENPPANLGLNFPPAPRKVIMEGPDGTDPLTTQSLGTTGKRQSNRAPDLAAGAAGLSGYELLTVVDGVAFVSIASSQGKTLVPVIVGSRLPGGLTVDTISQRRGRWALVAGNLTLEQKVPSAQ